MKLIKKDLIVMEYWLSVIMEGLGKPQPNYPPGMDDPGKNTADMLAKVRQALTDIEE